MKKKFQFILFFIIFIILSIFVYLYLFKFFSKSNFFISLLFKKITLTNFIILIFLILLYFITDGLRLFSIILASGHKIKFSLLIKLIFTNIFISNITPFSSGGGFIQIYYLNKANISIGEATAITTIRTVTAMFFFLISAPIILILDKSIDNIISAKSVFLYALIFMIIYLIIFYLIIKKVKIIKIIIYKFLLFLKQTGLIKKNQLNKLLFNVFQEINYLSSSIKLFLFNKIIFIFLNIVFTIFFLILLFSFTPFLLKILNIKFNILHVYFYQIIITFIMYFVPTPGSSGIAEASYAYIFKSLIPGKYIPALTFTWRFLTIYIGMMIGLIIILYDIIKTKKSFNNFDKNKLII